MMAVRGGTGKASVKKLSSLNTEQGKSQLDLGYSLDFSEISESWGKRVKAQNYLLKKKVLPVKSIRLLGNSSVKTESEMKGVRAEGELSPHLVLSCHQGPKSTSGRYMVGNLLLCYSQERQ